MYFCENIYKFNYELYERKNEILIISQHIQDFVGNDNELDYCPTFSLMLIQDQLIHLSQELHHQQPQHQPLFPFPFYFEYVPMIAPTIDKLNQSTKIKLYVSISTTNYQDFTYFQCDGLLVVWFDL